MKRTLIVGNWKMHFSVQQASLLVHRLQRHIASHRDTEVVLAPSLLALQPVSLEIDRRRFRLAAQNANATDEGALTGEVSFAMLRDLVHYCIIGHSERRHYCHETLDDVQAKVASCVRHNIVPIICIGETATERRAGETKRVLHDQIISALANLTGAEVAGAVIAYEPVWAIGSGHPAGPAAISEAMAYIRKTVAGLYGAAVAADLRVLYGGSVTTEAVAGILAIDGVDGLLVGGDSLNYQAFAAIVDAAHKHQVGATHAS